MNNYELKRQAKKDRLINAVNKTDRHINDLWSQQEKLTSVIPFGQPILIGHHSEKKHRRHISKIQSTSNKISSEISKKEYLENKINAIENNTAISSDDPNALIKLKEKLAILESRHLQYKEYNKKARQENKEILDAYILANSNQNIKSVKDRIAKLENSAKAVTKILYENETVKVIDNIEENRIQLVYNEKPSEEIRKELKRNGFKYSYTNNAWQRFRNGNSLYAAKAIFNLLNKGA